MHPVWGMAAVRLTIFAVFFGGVKDNEKEFYP